MKTSPNFELREVAGVNVLLAVGSNVDFSKLASLNETATFLWKELQNTDFEIEDMVDLIRREYDVPADVALADCKELLNKWLEHGIVIE